MHPRPVLPTVGRMSGHRQHHGEDERNPNEDLRLSRRVAWVFIVVFLLLIAGPPLAREGRTGDATAATRTLLATSTAPLAGRLRTLEHQLEDATWTRAPRQHLQSALLGVFGEGNRKVVRGKDGCYYYRPGLRALTGRGPMLPELASVAKDPALATWQGPLPVIRDFAAQLQARRIRLHLFPVPDKAALLAGRLTRHPDAPAFYTALREAGVDVIPPGDDWDRATHFLRQDTHWNRAGMRLAASRIADALHWTGENPEPAPRDLAGFGDLVERLDLAENSPAQREETTPAPPDRPVPAAPENATAVLLGDSFVNIYDDPGLAFAATGSGLRSALTGRSGGTLRTIAINGGGATTVRQALARLPQETLGAVRDVVWVIAERDLFLTADAARQAGIEWRTVSLSAAQAAAPAAPAVAGRRVIEATLLAKSALPDPLASPYTHSLFVARFTIDSTVSDPPLGTPTADVVLWNFKARKTQPPATWQPGQKVRLTLDLFDRQEELKPIDLTDDFDTTSLTLQWAADAMPLP